MPDKDTKALVVSSGSEHKPGDILPTDQIISRGTGAYHAAA